VIGLSIFSDPIPYRLPNPIIHQIVDQSDSTDFERLGTNSFSFIDKSEFGTSTTDINKKKGFLGI
jgi:hypothetical protein